MLSLYEVHVVVVAQNEKYNRMAICFTSMVGHQN